jgi:glycosyltransferase involved in cell wall biosynthesis
LGIVTIFHLDDLLQQMPADIGPKYAATYSDAYMAELHACILASDGVLASTPILAAHLAVRYPQHNIQTVLGVCYDPAPGWAAQGIRSRLARFKRRLSSVGVQTLGYMGSSSHLRDLATVTPQIAELMRERPNLRFETLGLPAPDVLKNEFGERIGQFGYARNYTEFLSTLYELNWDLGLAPLVQDDFNRAKTATKFVEYTACNVPTLAEDVEPYSSVGREYDAIALASGGAWAKAAAELLSNPASRHRQLRRAQALCRSSFTATAALGQMLAAIDELSAPRNQALPRSNGLPNAAAAQYENNVRR